jgi:hypothetical protein
VLEGLFNLGQKLAFQETGDLPPLGVHDAVNAKIQIGLVKLEKLSQQTFQFIQVCGHFFSP